MKALSLKELIQINGGYELPEVVCIGHKKTEEKTLWEQIQEALAELWTNDFLNSMENLANPF